MRLLLALGILGGATWIAYAFAPDECVPVTGASEVFCNRLWTPALFAMAVGFLGVWQWSAGRDWPKVRRSQAIVAVGGGLMTIGNFGEYWIFPTWSHDGPDGWLRSLLWMTVLLGWLATLLAALAGGLFLLLGRRGTLRQMVLGAILVTGACLTVFMGPLAIGVLAITASTYALIDTARGSAETATELA